MAGVDSNWQGTFVGLFLIAAVYLGKDPGSETRIAGSSATRMTGRKAC